jgi:hypothetical protein
MQPLHSDDNETVLGRIETAKGGVAKPFIGSLERYLRIRVIGLDRVVDDQDVAAATGQCAAD